jgi:helicase
VSTSAPRVLATRRGIVELPAYVPVTTFGARYPLDNLIRPYLPRLARAVMVSYHYARQMEQPPRLPLFLDSGGFAALWPGAKLIKRGQTTTLEIPAKDGGDAETLEPADVLELQEKVADVAFTLDFPIPPGLAPKDAAVRLDATITNAHWALANRRRADLLLFACIQAWDADSAMECARALAGAPFDGFGIGGLVPRARDRKLILAILEAVRAEVGGRPIHVFGLGEPALVRELFQAGAESVDSSSYVKLAADGRLWGNPHLRVSDASPTERLHLALCNLATAVGRTLPLSATQLAFETHTLSLRRSRQGEPSPGNHGTPEEPDYSSESEGGDSAGTAIGSGTSL